MAIEIITAIDNANNAGCSVATGNITNPLINKIGNKAFHGMIVLS